MDRVADGSHTACGHLLDADLSQRKGGKKLRVALESVPLCSWCEIEVGSESHTGNMQSERGLERVSRLWLDGNGREAS